MPGKKSGGWWEVSGTEICCLQPGGQLRHGQTEGDHPQSAGSQHALHCLCGLSREGDGGDGSERENKVPSSGVVAQI